MRPKTLGLVAALVSAVLVPAAAMSQGKKAPAAPAGVSEAARKAGMEKAPPVVQALGLNCQVSDARLIGEDKKTKTSYFEVACGSGGMGYVLQTPEGGQPTAFTCIEANTPPAPGQPAAAPCMLPANADPKAALTPMLQKAGVQCTPEQARGIGQTSTATYIEVACAGGAGYVVSASKPFDVAKTPQAQNCLLYDDAETNLKCTLVDKAARLAVVDRFAAEAGNNCTVKDRRFVGMSQSGDSFFETSCQDGKGYIYRISKGALAQTLECAKATAIMGGCQLTDARQAQSEQAGLYTRLATNAGATCQVEKYALFPMKGQEEVVELVCKDGKSLLGMFPPTGKGQVIDCGRALVAGYKCGLGKPDYASLTADLRKFDQKTCVVSNSRLAAKTQKGTTLLEVACADGFKGYMIEYQTTPTVTAVGAMGCAFSGNCQLPGNKS